MAEREPVRDKMQRNRPTLAGIATGLIVALGEWGIDAIPASVPGDVTAQLELAVVVVAGIIGAGAGKWAQQHTWAEDSHIEALEEAHRPEQLPDQAMPDEPAIAIAEGV